MINLTSFKNLKLKNKIILSYLTIIIPLVLMFVFFANHISSYISDQLKYSIEKTLEQTSSFLSYKLSSVIKTAQVIAIDPRMQEILSINQQNYDIYNKFNDYAYLKQYITNFETPKELYKVRLYVPNTFIYTNENDITYNLNNIENTTWYKRLMDSRLPYMLYSSNDTQKQDDENDVKLLSVLHNISSPSDYTKYIGAIRVDFYEDSINEILKKNDVVQGSITYIQNSIGEIITSSRDVDLYNISKNSAIDNGWTALKINGNNYYIGKFHLEKTDWDLITAVPFSEIQLAGTRFMTTLILSVFFIGTIVYFIAYFISSSITKKLDVVIEKFKNVEKGDLSKIDSTYTYNTDEVGELIKHYNYMVTEIQGLIDTQCKNVQEIKTAEMRILQAQINPHFLYNTLDLVRWLGLKNMCDEIIDVVQSLSNFFRSSLNNGSSSTSIKNELLHVTSYVQIQNIRFSNKIHLITEFDNDILGIQIPKIILQPLVENSILHGILNKPNKEGIIRIEGKLHNDTIVITITDDGIGIDAEKLKQINNGTLESKQNGGFGIKNVMDRIVLSYGKPYGLKYESECGKTTATITMPKNT